jgi:hypothetical protein
MKLARGGPEVILRTPQCHAWRNEAGRAADDSNRPIRRRIDAAQTALASGGETPVLFPRNLRSVHWQGQFAKPLRAPNLTGFPLRIGAESGTVPKP